MASKYARLYPASKSEIGDLELLRKSTILISAFSLFPAYQILQRDPRQKLTANNSGIDFFVTFSHRYLLALSSCILILAFALRSSEYGADMR